MDIDTRMALVEEIRQGMFDDIDESPLTDEQRNELDRRMAHHEALPDAGVPLEDVMSRVKNY